VLQDEEFFRVGGKRSVRVDSRVVVATNRDLEREIASGNFREDLFYRLNVVAIRLPPLRDRKEDIVPLVDHFLRKYGRKYKNGLAELPPEVLRAFTEYGWPGNVRELENMVRRLVVLKDPVLVIDALRSGGRPPASAPSLPTAYAGEVGVPVRPREGEPNVVRNAYAGGTPPFAPEPARAAYPNPFTAPQPPPPPPTKPESEMSLKEIGKRAAMLAEREAILVMLQRTAWNKRKAATRLRISYKALLYKIKEAGIVDPRTNAEF
jgi:DNA-binding NtrC family response regulator